MKAFQDSDADIRAVMRVLFNSDFFKAARFQRVKCPVELVAGVIKLAGTHRDVEPGLIAFDGATRVMGQTLMDPPTVEGWHTGKEWIDGGTLTERDQLRRQPGQRHRASRARSAIVAPARGPRSAARTRGARRQRPRPGRAAGGSARDPRRRWWSSPRRTASSRFGSDEDRQKSEERVGRLLRLTVASREYQFA